MSVDWGTCWPCAFIPACSRLCPPYTACSCSTRVKHTAHYIVTVQIYLNVVFYKKILTIYCPLLISGCRCLVHLISLFPPLSIFLYGRPINMPLCMGLPFGGRGRAAKHDPCHAERWPSVVWAQSCWCGLVDTQHQHSTENGGEGTGANSD